MTSTLPETSTATTTATEAKLSQFYEDGKKPSAPVDTSDLNLTALSLPKESDDSYLISQLSKYPVISPPPFTLPPEEIERDRALIRQSAAARGEHTHHQHDDVDGEDDEDVNGFLSSAAGRRAKKKVRLHSSTSPNVKKNTC